MHSWLPWCTITVGVFKPSDSPDGSDWDGSVFSVTWAPPPFATTSVGPIVTEKMVGMVIRKDINLVRILATDKTPMVLRIRGRSGKVTPSVGY